jgi:hypothetical protein
LAPLLKLPGAMVKVAIPLDKVCCALYAPLDSEMLPDGVACPFTPDSETVT